MNEIRETLFIIKRDLRFTWFILNQPAPFATSTMVDQGTAFAIFFLVVFGVPLAIIFFYCLFRFRVGKEEARSTPRLHSWRHT